MDGMVYDRNGVVDANWINICGEFDKREREWISMLRERGFKASHPNDGHVDRNKNLIHFAYPHFNDSASVGDLVMLGQPFDKENKLRKIRLTSYRDSFYAQFGFEYV